MSSFGDAIGVSDVVDLSLARVLKREVADLIIAPGYEPEALEILREKKRGAFVILQMDPSFDAPDTETRELFGFRLEQQRNQVQVSASHFQNIVTGNRSVSPGVIDTLIVATTALKYTQSNSVCVAYDGQVIGMGAGQQSRIHCTRLACDKADKWFLQQHPKCLNLAFAHHLKKPDRANLVDQYLLWDQLSEPERTSMLSQLTEEPQLITAEEKAEWLQSFQGICLSSDAFIPFRDNLDRANRSHVKYVAQAGSSARDDLVTAAADDYGMVMFHTGFRCFLH